MYSHVQQKSKTLLQSLVKPSECSVLLQTIATMKSDEVTIAARNDELIMRYGTYFAEKVGGECHHEVPQGIQQLARLQRNSTEIQSFKKISGSAKRKKFVIFFSSAIQKADDIVDQIEITSQVACVALFWVLKMDMFLAWTCCICSLLKSGFQCDCNHILCLDCY